MIDSRECLKSSSGTTQSVEYVIRLSGSPESSSFTITPPLSEGHYGAVVNDPRLARPGDFYLDRQEKCDQYTLEDVNGDEHTGGRRGPTTYYRRASYFAGIVEELLQRSGDQVSLTPDRSFERSSDLRMHDFLGPQDHPRNV